MGAAAAAQSLKSELGCPHFGECSGCSLQEGLRQPSQFVEAADFFRKRGFADFRLVSPRRGLLLLLLCGWCVDGCFEGTRKGVNYLSCLAWPLALPRCR